jgi:hypothetical protein
MELQQNMLEVVQVDQEMVEVLHILVKILVQVVVVAMLEEKALS